MAVLLAGVGGAPKPPVVSNPFIALPRFSSTWTGWDGSVWDLLRPQATGVVLQQGVRGLNMVSVDQFSSTSPALAGSRWRGSRVGNREVFWPIALYADPTNQEFVALDRAFWRTMHPERPGLWTVTQPSGESRTLSCRFVSDGDYVFDVDPHTTQWTTYGVTLVADQPYWSGAPISLSWLNKPDLTPPYPRPGQHDPYVLHLSSGRTLAGATVTNDGDVETYPTWLLKGPFDSAAVGVNGRQVSLPFGLAAGQSITLDTDPAQLTATREDGSDVTYLLGEADWAAVPAGGSVPLSLEMVGAGSVTVTVQQRFMRAW